MIPAEKKIRIVLSILPGEVSVAEAARREKVSEQSVGNWKRAFLEAGMSTAGFCQLIDMPERTWRRWQARARNARPVKGPWPRPVRDKARGVVRRHALAHPAWGHRKVWAMTRHDGLRVSTATVLRLLRDEVLILEANYARERRQLAARRKAAFATELTGAIPASGSSTTPEFETTIGGTWQLAGCRDYYSKYELGWHISPTANQQDARQRDRARPGRGSESRRPPLREMTSVDPDTGETVPLVTIVTDNGGRLHVYADPLTGPIRAPLRWTPLTRGGA